MSLQRYAQLQSELEEIRNEIDMIEDELRKEAEQTGAITGHGYTARFKPGRKITDHQAAAIAANVPDEIVKKHTTIKESVAWAKVTKEAGCATADFTTQGDPVFVIEKDEIPF